MKSRWTWIALLMLAPWLSFAEDKEFAGQLVATVDDQRVTFPVLRTDYDVDLQGDLATVTVTQSFHNPLPQPVHAQYLFPLSKSAAVYEMRMDVGRERIRARIQEIRQARKTFAKAQSEGRSAALLQQHRPNMFTQDIANLMPGVPITVTMRYVQTVPKVDGEYELVVPLVVGPRFQPEGAGMPPQPETVAATPHTQPPPGSWQLEALPEYPKVYGLDIPDSIDPARVSLKVQLHAGMPIAAAHSATHDLDIERPSKSHWNLRLAQGRVIDNRDFVLRYALGGERTLAGLLAHYDQRGGFFSLMIEPPHSPPAAQITPREMVFVLDCSGSMSGLPMAASKAFMRQALRNLRSTDSFRIIRFSDAATEFSTAPLPATPANIQAGLRYTGQLRGSGGTHMLSGIQQALAPPVPDGSMRIVVFLTDGYIGNEHTILAHINRHLGAARLYAFGVGTAVNRYLLSELARTGRGFVRYMDPTEHIEEAALDLAARLQSPVLTDIRVDWGGLAVDALNPEPIPDLFAGQSLRIMGRYTRPGHYTVQVHGNVRGRPASIRIPVDLPATPAAGEAVALTWARGRIAQFMNQFSLPVNERAQQRSDAQLQQAVTALGLEFALVSKWTAFIAVSEAIYNDAPAGTQSRRIPLARVAGVSNAAYGQTNPAAFAGNAAPEPAALAAMLLTGALVFGWWRRHRVGASRSS